MIPTSRTAPIPEACSRALLDASRALEYVLVEIFAQDLGLAQTHSKVIEDAALLCRAIARTLCVEPEATLLSVVLPFMEAISDDR